MNRMAGRRPPEVYLQQVRMGTRQVTTMKIQGEVLVRVHRDWDGWHSAEVRLRDLQDIQWLQPAHAPHQLLHGFVLCNRLVSGEIPHNCDSRSGPHLLCVCVLKRHAIATTYAELVRRASRLTDRERTASRAALAADHRSRLGV